MTLNLSRKIVPRIIRHCCPEICFVPLSYYFIYLFIYLFVIMQSIMPQLFPQSRLVSEDEWVCLSAELEVLLPHSWMFATGYYAVRNSTSSVPHSASSWHQCNYYILPSMLLSSKWSLSVRCFNRKWLHVSKPSRSARASYPPRPVQRGRRSDIFFQLYENIKTSSACNCLHSPDTLYFWHSYTL